MQVLGWTNATCPVAGDRNPIPGETVLLQVEIRNPSCSIGITNLTLSAGHGSVAVGTVAPGQVLVREVPFVIPGSASCGLQTTAQVNAVSDNAVGQVVRVIDVGQSSRVSTIFGNATPIDLPQGQPGTSTGVASPYPSQIGV